MALDLRHERFYWRRRLKAMEYVIGVIDAHLGVVVDHDKAEDRNVMLGSMEVCRDVLARFDDADRKGRDVDPREEERHWHDVLAHIPVASFAQFHLPAEERKVRGYLRGKALIAKEARDRYRNLIQRGVVLG